MRERTHLRTASIPSKNRALSAGNQMRESLVVKKLRGMTSPENSFMASSQDMTSNLDTFQEMSPARLKSGLKQKLSSNEHDQKSLEVLIRLLKSGPFTRDVINKENSRPLSSTIDKYGANTRDDVTASPTHVSDYVISNSSKSYSPRLYKPRPMTSEPVSRFRKSIEELKNTRERFGVSMAVNGTIARTRNIQQKNERSRRNATKEILPVLNGSSSGESEESEKQNTTQRHSVIPTLGPWLTLSGRKIQLKHQDHVERALGQPEPLLIQPKRDVTSRQRRFIKSAPPKALVKSIPVRKLAWSNGNRYIINKVFHNSKSPINFAASYHGYESPRHDNNDDKKLHQYDVTTEIKNDEIKTQKLPTPPSSYHSNESLSRPSSSSMPRPVRSVVIKLPNSGIVTSPSTSLPNMTSSTRLLAQTTNTFPTRPALKL